MSDVIEDAQQLLDGATPGPWEVDIDGLEVYSTVDGDAVAHAQTPSDADLIAAAPELAQALAEETYEYSFQTWYADGWETTRSKIARDEEWWTDKSIAEGVADRAYDPYRNRPIRMIRRRVSPPEVIDGCRCI